MRYYIYVRDRKIPVTKEVYRGYWQLVNHEKYIRRRDKEKGLLLFSSLGNSEQNIEEFLKDARVDVDRLVETKLMIEELYNALSTLSDKEFNIIKSLYFDDCSIREVAVQQAMTPSSLFRLRNKILSYLRNILDK